VISFFSLIFVDVIELLTGISSKREYVRYGKVLRMIVRDFFFLFILKGTYLWNN